MNVFIESIRALFRRFSGTEGVVTSRTPVLFKGKRGTTEKSILGSKSVTRVFRTYGGQEFAVIVTLKGSGMQAVIKFPIRRIHEMSILSVDQIPESLAKMKAWLELETRIVRPPLKWEIQVGFA